MDLIFPDAGLVYQMEELLLAQVKYHLYTNNHAPTLGDALGAYTEAAWSGYAAITQAWSNFTLNGVTGHNGYAIAPPIAFGNSSGSPQSAYGYFVTDLGGTILLAAAEFDSPPVVVASGATLNVLPTWGNYSQLAS